MPLCHHEIMNVDDIGPDGGNGLGKRPSVYRTLCRDARLLDEGRPYLNVDTLFQGKRDLRRDIRFRELWIVPKDIENSQKTPFLWVVSEATILFIHTIASWPSG